MTATVAGLTVKVLVTVSVRARAVTVLVAESKKVTVQVMMPARSRQGKGVKKRGRRGKEREITDGRDDLQSNEPGGKRGGGRK